MIQIHLIVVNALNIILHVMLIEKINNGQTFLGIGQKPKRILVAYHTFIKNVKEN